MFANTYELSAAGFLAAAASESRKLGGHMRLMRIAQAKGNRRGVEFCARRVQESADRVESLLTLAAEWAEMDDAA
ncbi:hypothetical protein [Streptomyces sp. MJM1172]|uniref:hypothetical protein n=1 Tax=Streptomyces sp. MJM1172 TaxID=1703926 RepID=UPI00093D261C|nr:hypothetical protein [Streptomyces sp. MJM1172]OKI71390.1 hypothetical protein AMK15_01820 [Streptomyces sp. MJM1172]